MIFLPDGDVFFRKQGNKVLDWGAHEFNILKPRIKKYRTCLDIGAHVGITTLRFAKHFKVVHSFEPLHYNLLAKNTSMLSNVIIHDCAISESAGQVEMYPNVINSGGGIIPDEYNSTIIQRRYTNQDAVYTDATLISVKSSSIDSFNISDIDLIKIDVEGYILPVITGMNKTLVENAPVIQIEMSAFDYLNTQVHEILAEIGYIKYNVYQNDWFYYKG